MAAMPAFMARCKVLEPVRLITKTGLLLMLLGACAFGGWMLWVATRVKSPIDMPVSMSVGHVRTSDFRVNLETLYLIEIEAETKAFPPDTLYCLLGYKITPKIELACNTMPSIAFNTHSLRFACRLVHRSVHSACGHSTALFLRHRGPQAESTFISHARRKFIVFVFSII